MYSDRVDSVTRATNPSLLPSLPSTPRAHLVRRPPPPPPPPVLGISQCIDVYKPPRLAVEFSLRRSFLSFSLFLVTYILSLPSMPHPARSLSLPSHLTHSSRPVRFFCSLSLSGVSRCVLGVSSIISSSHPIFLSLVSRTFSRFVLFAARYLALCFVLSHLRNSIEQSRSRVMKRVTIRITYSLLSETLACLCGSNRLACSFPPLFCTCDRSGARSRIRVKAK